MSIFTLAKKKQAEYWQERAERKILAAEKAADEMLRGQIDAWETAEKNIERQIQAFYGRYAKETGLTIAEVQKRLNAKELKAAKDDIARYYEAVDEYGMDDDYKVYLRSLSARAYMSRLEELKSNMRYEIEVLYASEQQAFLESLGGVYTESYYRTIFDVQQATGIASSFTTPNTKIVEKAVSQKWLGDNYSDRIWNNKDRLVQTLEKRMPQGIAMGHNPNKIAIEIRKDMNTSRSNAERLARTEFNHIANEATADGYKECGVEQYQFLATLDHKTSDLCQEADLKIYNRDEMMVGVNYPPMHPRCRSTTTAYYPPDEIDEMYASARTRIARDPNTGKSYYVPADLSYSEWKDGLTESQGKSFLSNQKMDKYNASDKKQFESYKQFIREAKKEHDKNTVSGLFDGFPTKFSDFQSLKYTEPDKWMIFKDNRQKLR